MCACVHRKLRCLSNYIFNIDTKLNVLPFFVVLNPQLSNGGVNRLETE